MKINKLLIGCSILITISPITGCSNKSDSKIDDLIETTVVSKEELNKNAREITGSLPDNSIANIHEPLNENDPNIIGQPNLDVIGEITAIHDTSITISIKEEVSTDPPEGPTQDSTLDGTKTTITELILTVTNETFINIQKENKTTATSFSEIRVGDIVKFSYTSYKTGEQILSTITIINTANTETIDSEE